MVVVKSELTVAVAVAVARWHTTWRDGGKMRRDDRRKDLSFLAGRHGQHKTSRDPRVKVSYVVNYSPSPFALSRLEIRSPSLFIRKW